MAHSKNKSLFYSRKFYYLKLGQIGCPHVEGYLYLSGMDTLIIILLIVAVLLVVGALVGGLIAMARGGELGPKRSNMFMRYRVLFQGIAVLLVVILLSIAGD